MKKIKFTLTAFFLTLMDAVSEIKQLEPHARVLDGLHIGAASTVSASKEVNAWVEELRPVLPENH